MANADSVVVELIAENDKFDANVRQSANEYQTGMDKIVASAGKAEKAQGRMTLAANNSRIAMLEMQHVVRGSVDQFAAGAPVTQIFAQHVASVAEAASLSGGALGAFGEVLAGPVGLAITAATAIIATLIAKHREEGDTVDALVAKLKKHYEQTKLNEQAEKLFDATVEGSISKMHDLTEEILKQNLSLEDNINLKKAAIAVGLQNVASNIGSVSSELATAIAELKSAQLSLNEIRDGTTALSGEEAAVQSAALIAAQQRFDAAKKSVADLTAKLNGLSSASAAARKGLQSVDFPLIEQNAKDATDPIAAINHHFDDLASKARLAGTYTQAFANALEKQREAALEAAKANKKLGEGLGGVQIDFAEASRIARAAGFTVTSAQRSTARQAQLFNDPSVNRPGNPVARPGTSAHEGFNGKWALDIAFAPGLTPQKLRKAFGAEGVSLSVVKKEAGHFHIEGSRSDAAAQEREQQRLADQARENEARFVQEKDSAEQQVIAARLALAKSAEEVWSFEAAAAIAAHKKTDDLIDAQLAAGKLLPQEAVELRKINDERAKYAQQLADQRLREAQFARETEDLQRGRDFQSASYEAEADRLQSLEGLARTTQQRKAIEDRLIDLEFEEERLKNQYIIDWAARVQANKDATDKEKADAALAAQIAQMHQNTLPDRQANAHSQNAQGNLTPLQSYFNSIPQTAQEIDNAFEQIAANGLQTFNDALASAIVNFTSLRDVGRQVLAQLATDLIKFALQQIELHTLGQLFATTSTATTVAQMAAIAAAAAPAAAMVSLATFGTNAVGAQAGIASTVALATILGAPKALGGRILGPGTTTSDSILTPSSVDEFMIRASSARAVGYDVLDYINRTGRLPNPSNSRASIPGGGGFGADLSQLDAMIDKAIRAMPPVIVHPVVDSGEVVSKGVKTGKGSRAVIAHVSENPTAYKSAMGRPGS